MEDSARRGRDKYEREKESSDRRRGSEWREREQPRKRLDDDDDDGRRNLRRRDRSNHGTESSAEDGGYSSVSDGRRRSNRRNSGRNDRESDREKIGSGRRGQEQEKNRKRVDAKDRNERQEMDSDGKRSYSSDSDDRRQNNQRASERNEGESDREKIGSEGRWQEDEQNRKRLDARDMNEGQESGSDGKGSYSSDSDNRRWANRRTSERDERESDRERIGSERRGQELEQHRKRLDARYRNGRRSESSSDGSYTSDSDSRRRSNRSTKERNHRERGRERQEQGQEKNRKNLQEAEDWNRKTREDVRDKNGRQHDLESSGDERDKRNELQQSRKRMDKEKDSQQGFRKGRDDMKEGNRENDLENSGEDRDKKRSERQEQEQPRKRLGEDDEDMHRNKKDKKKNGHLENDSESSDEEQEKKRNERKKMEQSRKRLDEDEKDTKEPMIEGRHGKRRDERSRKNMRRGSDSESSGGESRRHDKERRRRERERRRRRYDSDDSLDSDGRRRRHRTHRKNEQKDDKVMKQRHDLEDVDVRSMRERGEKASELKQVAKDGKREEAAKPQKQSTEANANPGGDLATLGRTGGVYIPPFKLARMMKEIEDKSSVEYQRLTWDALRKSINGLVNKVNATNIKNIIPELFSENLIRGRGLFCRSCMKSQMASPGFTDVFAALVAVVNTKFPEVGDLLLRRIVLQLKRAYKRNDKPQLIAAVKFIAHLVNQQVAHELVALELLTILLEQPTDDSVEVAVDFVKECGSILQDLCPKGLHGIFERFRGILHEGEIDKRVQFLIEGLFAIRKAKFQGHPAVRPELDLVEPEEQLTHEISLEDEIDPEIGLDIFRQDPNFVDNEKRYEELKKSILGDDSEDEDGSDAESADDDDDDDEEDEDDEEEQMQIKDETETNLVNLRRTIYLTIMSSVDFEEAGHKLLKIKLEPGQEMELCIMLLECCSQERTYLRYYGLLGQRFCMLNKVHQENFEKCFVQQYSMIHRLETNKLRNVAKFFAHLLGTDALPWHVLAYIRLTEEDTTSSSRIFIKILFQELSEHLGIRLLNERLNDPAMGDSFESIFPKDNPRNTRFSINFFTSIGLGGITENLREYLKNMPRMIMQQQKPESEDESGSGSGSDSDSDSDSDSSSSESGSSSEDSDNSSSSDESSDNDDERRRKRKNDGGSGQDRDRDRDRKRRKKN